MTYHLLSAIYIIILLQVFCIVNTHIILESEREKIEAIFQSFKPVSSKGELFFSGVCIEIPEDKK